MKVKELIKLLANTNQEAEIDIEVPRGVFYYESHYQEKIKLNFSNHHNKDWVTIRLER